MEATDVIGLIVIGFAAGMAGGLLGVGGGVLFVPGLVIFLDESQLHALSTSLVAVVLVAIVGTWRQRGYGNVRLKDGLIVGRAVADRRAAWARCSPTRSPSACWRCRSRSSSSISPTAWRSARDFPRGALPASVAPVEILHVKSEDRDGLVHIALKGELDLSSASKLQEELRRAEAGAPPVDRARPVQARVPGLHRTALPRHGRRARQGDGRRVVIVRGPDPVQRVFSITRLEERLEMVDDASARRLSARGRRARAA